MYTYVRIYIHKWMHTCVCVSNRYTHICLYKTSIAKPIYIYIRMYDECRVVQTQNNVVRNGLMQFKEIKQQQPQNLKWTNRPQKCWNGWNDTAQASGMAHATKKLGRQQKGLGWIVSWNLQLVLVKRSLPSGNEHCCGKSPWSIW